jgi:hypothetical protein
MKDNFNNIDLKGEIYFNKFFIIMKMIVKVKIKKKKILLKIIKIIYSKPIDKLKEKNRI